MTQDWKRLGDAIRDARTSRGMTQIDLATAAEVSEATVQNLEGARKNPRRRPPSLPRIEAALNWAAGSATRILEGGAPLDAPSPPASAPPPASDSQLPLRVQHELRDSEVVDTDVLDLSAGGMRLVVVVTRGG
ncbi:helix-turn-helix domain-containing protein, partial [Streptantibioticus silvisoli]